jgi:arginase family enzyme
MQVFKVGLSSEKNTQNCAYSPDKILESLRKFPSNEKGVLINHNSLIIEEIKINNKDMNESDYLIFENSKESFQKNQKSIFIGGDHSISYPILRAFNKIEKNPYLIVFDANVDCSDRKKSLCGSWIRKLIDSGFSPSSIVIVSARNFSEESILFLKTFNIQIIKMDIIQEDISGICDVIMERARKSSGFYISVDISSVDPGFSPGAIDIEPAGILSRELIYFLKRLNLLNNLKGLDIVNLDCSKDLNNMTTSLCAKIIAEIM